MVEKYTAQAVAPVEIIMELIKPFTGSKLFPVKIIKFLIRWVDGIREIACCWISVVLLVALIIIIRNGITLRMVRKKQVLRLIQIIWVQVGTMRMKCSRKQLRL